MNRPLFWILALAFGLRLCGIGFGLPHLFHQDEPIIVNHAMAYGGGDFNPHFFKIPPLTSYLLFFLYGLYYGLTAVTQGVSPEGFAVLFFCDPSVFYLIARIVFGAILGTASVYLLFRLTKKKVSENAACWAALLFSVSFLHVQDSHYVYADIPMIFSMLMALSVERAALSGFWVGTAVAFKYIAAPILFPVLFIRRRRREVLAVLGSAAAAYAVLNPFGILDFHFFIKEILQQAKAESPVPFFHHLSYSLGEGHGFGAVIVGLLGAIILWRNRPALRWLFIFPVIYYLMTVFFSQPYERYAMPLVPFLCLTGGYTISLIFEKSFGRTALRTAAWFLAALSLGPTLVKSVYLDALICRPDTRAQARAWIHHNVPPGEKIVLDHPFFSPPLTQSDDQILSKASKVQALPFHKEMKLKKLRWLLEAHQGEKKFRVYYLNEGGVADTSFLASSPALPPDPEVLEREGVRYYIRYRHPGESRFFEERMKSQAVLVNQFSPYHDGAKVHTEDPWANVALPFLSRELYSRRAPGPYLEIYELKHGLEG